MAIFQYPAVCPNCGLLFPSGFAFGLRSQVTLSGNRSRCPRCGSVAVVPDGMLEVLERGIKLFSGPDFTLEVLRAFEVAVEDLRAGRKTAAQTEKRLAEVHKGLSREFREWSTWGFNLISAMAAVAALVVALQSQPSNRTVDEAAVDGFESVYEQVQVVSPLSRPISQSTPSASSYPEHRLASPIANRDRPTSSNRAQRRAAASKAKKKRS